jgi:CRP/FNR family cyclic AMP-dependent transcriptional regulator
LDRIAAYLSQHPYFRELDPQRVSEIGHQATVRTLVRGEVLALEGEPCTTVYLLLEGRVRALKMSPQGREQVVRELRPPEAIYLVPALDGGPLPTTTRAATRATLVAYPRDAMVGIITQHPTVALQVLHDLAGRLRRFTTLIEDLSLRTVSERLAKLLIERAALPDPHRITQQEMAIQLGTVREVVARTLAQFEAQGWIHLRRGTIEILDLDALHDVAYPDGM